MTSFCRRLIKDFAAIARGVIDLTKQPDKDQKCELTPKGLESFYALKEALSDPTYMEIAELDKPFVLRTDASKHGLGAVLVQADEAFEDRLRPVEYASGRTNLAERNDSAMDLEAVAVVGAVLKMQDYMRIQSFQLETNHMALKWLLGNKQLRARLVRLGMTLRDVEFTIIHHPGALNQVADALSRCYALLEDDACREGVTAELLADAEGGNHYPTGFDEVHHLMHQVLAVSTRAQHRRQVELEARNGP